MVADLIDDYRQANLSVADRTMLDFAVKLSLAARDMQEADVRTLRDHGFGDRAILDICQVASYFNYVNRVANGLGVELEPFWERDVD